MNNYANGNQQVHDATDEDVEEVLEIVERLPEEKRQVIFQHFELYQGDLPHPDILKGYNELYPEAAKKIIDNGIAESEHRRTQEVKSLKAQINISFVGQIFGFIVALVIIGAGAYLILNNHEITGSIMTGVSALGVIGLFTGQNQNKTRNK